jgi:hypothetical protein
MADSSAQMTIEPRPKLRIIGEICEGRGQGRKGDIQKLCIGTMTSPTTRTTHIRHPLSRNMNNSITDSARSTQNGTNPSF